MSTTYGTIITEKGAAKILACVLNGTKVNVTQAVAGDGGGVYYIPTINQEELVNEKWRGDIASAEIDPTVANMINVKVIIGDDVGGFTIREMGLVDSDGDLLAVCNTPATEKVAIAQGVTGKLTMIMHVIVTDASVVAFSVNPSLDTVSREDLKRAVAEHNNDPSAHEDIRAALDGAVSASQFDFVIPVSAWAEDTNPIAPYTYYADVRNDLALMDYEPEVTLDRGSMGIAAACGMCQGAETVEDGVIRFWAEEIPSGEISGTCILLALGSGAITFFASDEEVDAMLNDVYGAQP